MLRENCLKTPKRCNRRITEKSSCVYVFRSAVLSYTLRASSNLFISLNLIFILITNIRHINTRFICDILIFIGLNMIEMCL